MWSLCFGGSGDEFYFLLHCQTHMPRGNHCPKVARAQPSRCWLRRTLTCYLWSCIVCIVIPSTFVAKSYGRYLASKQRCYFGFNSQSIVMYFTIFIYLHLNREPMLSLCDNSNLACFLNNGCAFGRIGAACTRLTANIVSAVISSPRRLWMRWALMLVRGWNGGQCLHTLEFGHNDCSEIKGEIHRQKRGAGLRRFCGSCGAVGSARWVSLLTATVLAPRPAPSPYFLKLDIVADGF